MLNLYTQKSKQISSKEQSKLKIHQKQCLFVAESPFKNCVVEKAFPSKTRRHFHMFVANPARSLELLLPNQSKGMITIWLFNIAMENHHF